MVKFPTFFNIITYLHSEKNQIAENVRIQLVSENLDREQMLLRRALLLSLLVESTLTVEVFRRGEECLGIKYKQVVSTEGCREETITNYFCQGKCMSGFVPENGGEHSCRSCKPMQTVVKPIILNCRNGSQVKKTVELYKNCKCVKSTCKQNQTFLLWKSVLIPPCRNICRSCRKARRRHQELVNRRDHMEFLKDSCKTKKCNERINNNISRKLSGQKLAIGLQCRSCQTCRERKKENFHVQGD